MAASWQLFHFLEDIISYLIIKEMVVIKQIAVASIERVAIFSETRLGHFPLFAGILKAVDKCRGFRG